MVNKKKKKEKVHNPFVKYIFYIYIYVKTFTLAHNTHNITPLARLTSVKTMMSSSAKTKRTLYYIKQSTLNEYLSSWSLVGSANHNKSRLCVKLLQQNEKENVKKSVGNRIRVNNLWQSQLTNNECSIFLFRPKIFQKEYVFTCVEVDNFF